MIEAVGLLSDLLGVSLLAGFGFGYGFDFGYGFGFGHGYKSGSGCDCLAQSHPISS